MALNEKHNMSPLTPRFYLSAAHRCLLDLPELHLKRKPSSPPWLG